MLKIVSVPNGSGTATLVLEGRLVGPWVEELRRSCEQASSSSDGLTLDLWGVFVCGFALGSSCSEASRPAARG